MVGGEALRLRRCGMVGSEEFHLALLLFERRMNMVDEKDYKQVIAEHLDGVQPSILSEPNAYKRAVIRMAIEEYERMNEELKKGLYRATMKGD